MSNANHVPLARLGSFFSAGWLRRCFQSCPCAQTGLGLFGRAVSRHEVVDPVDLLICETGGDLP
jgi:hypothetical protein